MKLYYNMFLILESVPFACFVGLTYNCIDTIVSRCQILSLKNPTDEINENIYQANVIQKNDIYLAIEKNKNYSKKVFDYIKRAIKLGYKTLAFTEHIPFPTEMTKVIVSKRMYIEQLNDYINEINLKKQEYKDKIEILVGLECEYLDFLEPIIEEASKKCDFLILGQHYIKVKNKYKSIYNVSEENYLDIYFSTAQRALSTGLFKIIAHPDIFLWKIKDWNPNYYCVIEYDEEFCTKK